MININGTSPYGGVPLIKISSVAFILAGYFLLILWKGRI